MNFFDHIHSWLGTGKWNPPTPSTATSAAAASSVPQEVADLIARLTSELTAAKAALQEARVSNLGLVTQLGKVQAAPPAPAPASTVPAPPAAEPVTASPTPAPAPTETVVTASEWPKVITIDGVRIMAKAPINPNWKASMMAHIFAQPGVGYVYDPSNGDKANPAQPLRSAASYPLFYALGNDHSVVGTPSVVYGDQSFNSDTEVEAYIQKTTLTPEQLAAQAAAWGQALEGLKAQAPPKPVKTVEVSPSAPQPAPAPAPVITALANHYVNDAALVQAANDQQFAVLLNGKVIKAGPGRDDGSPYQYQTTEQGVIQV